MTTRCPLCHGNVFVQPPDSLDRDRRVGRPRKAVANG